MTQAIPLLTLSEAAIGTLAAHRFITFDGMQAGADGNTLGVTRTAAVSGEFVAVDVIGTAIVEAGAAIAVGATLKSDADGRAITWATAGAKVAMAFEAASAAGDLIEVLLLQNAP